MSVALFLAAIIWASLSAQFAVQTITSLGMAIVHISAFLFSRSGVPRSLNIKASMVAITQCLVFAALSLGGNWIAFKYIDYAFWNATTIVSFVFFLATIVYCALQVPSKLLFAKMCAWEPFFTQAAMRTPNGVAFAMQVSQAQTEDARRKLIIDTLVRP